MGYTTDFSGSIKIEPPLNPQEIAYLNKFSETRRMAREKGPYYVDGSGAFGQDRDPDILNYNQPPEGQPGLWCQWVVNELGDCIEWNGSEKFYYADLWMKYLIEHFLQAGSLARYHEGMEFLGEHILNGLIEAQGEDADDRWDLIVENNRVYVQKYKQTKDERKLV